MKQNKNYIKSSLFYLSAMGLLASSAHAATIVTYEFAGGSPSPTNIATGVVAQSFAFSDASSGESGATDIGFSSSSLGGYVRTLALGTSEAAALADDDYFTFTISAENPGELLDLESMTFDYGASNSSSFDATISTYIQSDVGGFGTGNPVIYSDSVVVPQGTTAGGAYVSTGNTVVLSGLAPAESYTFQFRFASSLQNGNIIARFGDVAVDGAVIPEPNAIGFALLSMVGLLAYRVRASRKK
ncbi:hypothetical protein [Cerasicoccus maritimus]|uniref:hypothetical protein n=1 Tax=Cerasicoccus maritimus TaxID=490089 RepID=UPI0028524C2B|nr:hypothetical protein [Cerasicoccus maritimus]